MRKTSCLRLNILCSNSRQNFAEQVLIEAYIFLDTFQEEELLLALTFLRMMRYTSTWKAQADFYSAYFWKGELSVPNRNKLNQWPFL